MQLQNELKNQYATILKKSEYQPLIQAIANDHKNGKGKGFSDILLGFVPDNYETAEHKILIVGRELVVGN